MRRPIKQIAAPLAVDARAPKRGDGGSRSRRGDQITVAAGCDDYAHYPFTESVLDHARLQPYIHDCVVDISEGRHTYSYIIFFKRHRRLPLNCSLGSLFRGDVVVMRLGTRNARVVNMRGRDSALVDFAMEQYYVPFLYALTVLTSHVRRFIHTLGSLRVARRLPKRLAFDKPLYARSSSQRVR